MSAADAADERARLQALRRYEVLETPAEPAFDDLALLAAQICQTPFAQITFVDEHREWIKARVGADVTPAPQRPSFCAHAIIDPQRVLEIHDLSTDARFAGHPPTAGAAAIRFQAGAPLVTPDGFAVGALCVLDAQPRTLTDGQRESLRALSRQIVVQLELRRRTREFDAQAAERDRVQQQLRAQNDALLTSQRETSRLLALADNSRRALLSVLEDERLSGVNLRESEERFRQVVENIKEVFWLSDVEEGRFIYISPGYESIWGRSREELYASPGTWSESIQPEDRARALMASQSRDAATEFDETYRITRPDGQTRWIRALSFPVKSADGRVHRMVGVAEDVTERKKLEEQFLHAQRMEAIGTLASGVAHDLNSILAPMLMVAGLLKDRLGTPKDREMLSMMERSGRRGAAIIQQLLTFSRGVPGERVTLQASHLVRDMAQIMRETFPRNISIVESVPSRLCTVQADPTQLHQVLMNLCVNARDAMPFGGTLTLALTDIRVTPENSAEAGVKPGMYLAITVTDTGQGIPPEIIGRIFDPFFTTKGVGKGTGLGLSTVVGIVKSHSGNLTVESELKRGSTFTVYLPGNEQPDLEQESIGAAEPLPRGRGELVLVVDDEESIRYMTRNFLERHGYRVLVAGDGQDAIRIFMQFQAAMRLVLSDIMMPGMDGVALIRALRVLKPSIKVIATSGLDQAENQEEFSRLGVTEFLPKPCPPEKLLRSVHGALA